MADEKKPWLADKIIAARNFILWWYHTLPKWAQALVVIAEGAVASYLIQWVVNGGALCFNSTCLKQFFGGMVAAVILAVRNWLKQSPLAGAVVAKVAQKQVAGR